MCYETCSKDTKTEVVVKKVAEVFLTLDCRPEQLVQLLTEDQLVQKKVPGLAFLQEFPPHSQVTKLNP